MPKIKDLSPKLRLLNSEQELEFPFGLEEMGQRIGGLAAFSNSFKRGYGDDIYGIDDNGVWMGAAEFGNAPLKMFYDGSATFNNITVNGYIATGDAAADINGGSVEINGNKIVAGSLSVTSAEIVSLAAGKITAQIIDSQIASIEWAKITNVSIENADIQNATIESGKIVSLNADLLTAGTITSIDIIGNTIKTSTSGARVEMNNATDDIRFYNGGGSLRGTISAGDGTLKVSSSTEELFLEAGNGIVEVLSSDLRLGGRLDANNKALDNVNSIDGGGNDVDFDDSISLEGNNINNVNAINVDFIDAKDGGSGPVQVNADFHVAGELTADTKTFLILHPDGSDRLLRYTSQESPDVVLRYRGIATIVGGLAILDLPLHFMIVTDPGGLITVNLTATKSVQNLHVEDIVDISNIAIGGNDGDFIFEVIVTREGYSEREVEISVDSPQQKDKDLFNSIKTGNEYRDSLKK